MGWWVIDPETGMPMKTAASKAKPRAGGVFVNAFPGIDDDAQSHYLGDEPMDYADDSAEQLRSLFGKDWAPKVEEVRRLINQGLIDDGYGLAAGAKARAIVGEFWGSIENAYSDSWQRQPSWEERRWCGELLVRSVGGE